MIEKIKQKIKEEIIKLPKEKQEAMGSFDWVGEIEEIGKKHLLTENELGDFQLETTLVLLGLVSIDLYTNNIENNIGTSKDEAKQITSEVFDEIFTPMANYIETPKTNKPTVFDPRFSSMPKGVQDAISRSNWKEELYKIAPKYKLTVEQMGILEEITSNVMLDIIHPDKYENELASKITIAKEDISNLVNNVNENILKKIRELEQNSSKEQVVSSKDVGSSMEQVVSRKDVEIPLPPYVTSSKENKEIPKNIIEEKLQGVTVSTNTVSDQSISKIHDPYHEPIE